MTAIAQALSEYADELELRQAGAGLAYLVVLRDRALTHLSSGLGQAVVSSTVNGQTFSTQVTLSADNMFASVSEAIREQRGDAVKITYARVIGIPH